MVVTHRAAQVVDRIVLDLDEPSGRAPTPSRARRGRRALAWGAVAAAAAVLAVGLTHGSDRAAHRPARHAASVAVVKPPPAPGPAVDVFAYHFQLPSGLHVIRHGHLPRPDGSDIYYVDAGGRRAGIDVSVMRGPVAAERAAAPLPAPMRVTRTRIGGYPATVDRFGVGGSGPAQMDVRVRIAARTLIWVESESVASDDVVAMLTRALG